ncbi:MAG: Arc family DNA-binding protein [Muribaculaceae bacterium]|jgi:hypothetical protein|uniref:Arc family DNA-binding protein n=1 Tax=uncultured Duncaniella sp. TaxID=2768039 RepID=UPI00260979C2|nr:Arc family DNA-binding protein [uncultured Duncaniella sp.]MCI8999179.1 Arc family DNA-binding protein [Muribaculaceae bacterium]
MAKKEAGKSFLLRLDASTMEKVEAWAAQEFRSVNGQIQWIIAEALKKHGRMGRSEGEADK